MSSNKPSQSQGCYSAALISVSCGSWKPCTSWTRSVLRPHEFTSPVANSKPAVGSMFECQRLQITVFLHGVITKWLKQANILNRKPTHETFSCSCCPCSVTVSHIVLYVHSLYLLIFSKSAKIQQSWQWDIMGTLNLWCAKWVGLLHLKVCIPRFCQKSMKCSSKTSFHA